MRIKSLRCKGASKLSDSVAVTITDSKGTARSYIVSQDCTTSVRLPQDCLISVGVLLNSFGCTALSIGSCVGSMCQIHVSGLSELPSLTLSLQLQKTHFLIL